MRSLSELVAVDAHVHVNDARAVALQGERAQQMARYFSQEREPVSLDDMAGDYRRRHMMAVLVNTTDVTVSGRESLPNEHLAEAVQRNPDVFLGLGAVDPWQGRLALAEIRRFKDLGLAGIGELNPARQHFFPHDRRFYPLWEAAEEEGLVVLFHGGYAASGSGTPGGAGVKLRYARPIYLDDVAADFPGLRIVCGHPAWPWESEALAMTLHKANVFMDLSGWAPRYFSAELRQYVNSRISHKVLFGTDWPALSVDRWLSELEGLGLKPEVRGRVLRDNAVALFGLDEATQPR